MDIDDIFIMLCYTNITAYRRSIACHGERSTIFVFNLTCVALVRIKTFCKLGLQSMKYIWKVVK